MTPSSSSASLVLKNNTDQYYSPLLSLKALYKYVVILGIFFLFILYTFLQVHPSQHQLPYLLARFQEKWPPSSFSSPSSLPPPSRPYTVNISDIMFGIAGTVKTWRNKKAYIESWWKPNVTRGYLFLEEPPGLDSLPWPPTSPPYKVIADVTKLELFKKFPSPIQLRIVLSILETFKQGDESVKWFVLTDDDTVMVIENLVEVLGKYDHTKHMYIGMNSEAVKSNSDFAFEMAFGGGGYALSYPLMEAVAENLDNCIERYPHLVTSDYILSACMADLGVDPTFERGFHQVDLHGDISGLLSAHPNAPFVSIHHMDTIEPIFPSKNRTESIHQLLQAAKMDHTRILQQTICHYRPNYWSFSVSWGYSLQIYESVFPRWLLKRPIETFIPWLTIARPPYYMFNTRLPTDNPCEAPHSFFAESMETINLNGEDLIVTTFVRRSPRGLTPCPLNGHRSADSIKRVKVFSPTTRKSEGRGDCCNAVHIGASDVEIRYRACKRNELIG